MPPLESVDLWQDAVYWPPGAPDRYNEPTRGSPVQIEVRWVWQDRKTTNAQGEEIETSATVITDREIPIGSFMVLGTLSDWLGTGSAGADDALMEVVTEQQTPDLKARNTRYQYGLSWFRDTPPDEEVP